MRLPVINDLRFKEVISFLAFTFIFVFALFYLDEGMYSIEWIADPGAWLVFFIYLTPMLLLSLALYTWVFRIRKMSFLILSAVLGSLAGLFLLILIF